MNNQYYQQAQLMLQLLPIVAGERCFALKGGTAINFFIRDLPRYSVDVDLTFVETCDRDTALQQIAEATESIAQTIEKRFSTYQVRRQYTKKTNRLVKLLIRNQQCQVKIEPNELVRGTVYPVKEQTIVPIAEQTFKAFVSMPILSMADLYGGKICAALDRQHPRDLFDIHLLLENEGLTDEIRQAFVVYLASHNRPMAELLAPNFHDIAESYKNDFEGMTTLAIDLNTLCQAREQLVNLLNAQLTEAERKFLLSIKQGEPEWNLLPIDGLDQFPAIQWKLLNIRKMDSAKHKHAIDKLKAVLDC